MDAFLMLGFFDLAFFGFLSMGISSSAKGLAAPTVSPVASVSAGLRRSIGVEVVKPGSPWERAEEPAARPPTAAGGAVIVDVGLVFE